MKLIVFLCIFFTITQAKFQQFADKVNGVYTQQTPINKPQTQEENQYDEPFIPKTYEPQFDQLEIPEDPAYLFQALQTINENKEITNNDALFSFIQSITKRFNDEVEQSVKNDNSTKIYGAQSITLNEQYLDILYKENQKYTLNLKNYFEQQISLTNKQIFDCQDDIDDLLKIIENIKKDLEKLNQEQSEKLKAVIDVQIQINQVIVDSNEQMFLQTLTTAKTFIKKLLQQMNLKKFTSLANLLAQTETITRKNLQMDRISMVLILSQYLNYLRDIQMMMIKGFTEDRKLRLDKLDKEQIDLEGIKIEIKQLQEKVRLLQVKLVSTNDDLSLSQISITKSTENIYSQKHALDRIAQKEAYTQELVKNKKSNFLKFLQTK